MYASSAWSFFFTSTQQQQLEDVQKTPCRIILGPAYTYYDHVLTTLRLPRLSNKHREALLKLSRDLCCLTRGFAAFSPLPPPRPVYTTRHNNVVMPIRIEHPKALS
ncbi:hypothetical protein E2C01_012931 [Portunus trituberculatus]|uniref:Uncharacterized protein n=1 Tax=Portunus trituberculatus TaxID=210409 RepID=A0A5B7DEZ3_PORTR|nr:hypothetical protein [Portunus trituberculatus]